MAYQSAAPTYPFLTMSAGPLNRPFKLCWKYKVSRLGYNPFSGEAKVNPTVLRYLHNRLSPVTK